MLCVLDDNYDEQCLSRQSVLTHTHMRSTHTHTHTYTHTHTHVLTLLMRTPFRYAMTSGMPDPAAWGAYPTTKALRQVYVFQTSITTIQVIACCVAYMCARTHTHTHKTIQAKISLPAPCHKGGCENHVVQPGHANIGVCDDPAGHTVLHIGQQVNALHK